MTIRILSPWELASSTSEWIGIPEAFPILALLSVSAAAVICRKALCWRTAPPGFVELPWPQKGLLAKRGPLFRRHPLEVHLQAAASRFFTLSGPGSRQRQIVLKKLRFTVKDLQKSAFNDPNFEAERITRARQDVLVSLLEHAWRYLVRHRCPKPNAMVITERNDQRQLLFGVTHSLLWLPFFKKSIAGHEFVHVAQHVRTLDDPAGGILAREWVGMTRSEVKKLESEATWAFWEIPVCWGAAIFVLGYCTTTWLYFGSFLINPFTQW